MVLTPWQVCISLNRIPGITKYIVYVELAGIIIYRELNRVDWKATETMFFGIH